MDYAEERCGFVRLNESNLDTGWIRVKGGDGKGSFCVCGKLPDGSTPTLNGNIKLEVIFGDTLDEWKTCTVVGNSNTLDEPFLFTSEHIGKAGIECEFGKNLFFKLTLQPNTGDDVVIGWIC